MRIADAADVNDAGMLQFVGEHFDHQLQYVVIERSQRAVDQHPRGHLNQHPGKGQT